MYHHPARVCGTRCRLGRIRNLAAILGLNLDVIQEIRESVPVGLLATSPGNVLYRYAASHQQSWCSEESLYRGSHAFCEAHSPYAARLLRPHRTLAAFLVCLVLSNRKARADGNRSCVSTLSSYGTVLEKASKDCKSWPIVFDGQKQLLLVLVQGRCQAWT
jgi:hypothetical protein